MLYIYIYISKTLPEKKVDMVASFKECLFVEIKLINKTKLLFVYIYRSDAGSD